MASTAQQLVGYVLIPGLTLFIVYAALVWLCRAPEDRWLATVARPLLTGFVKVVHRLRVIPRQDCVPATGPILLVANHRSGLDPVLLGVMTRRRVRFLMAREYFEMRGLSWVFRHLGCIPVNRDGNDLGATKAALKALREGEAIGIFPQGGIRDSTDSLEGKAGVALLCLRSGAAVVPCYIDGSPSLDSVFRSLITPSRSRVYCGAPLVFPAQSGKPTRETLERVTTVILDAIGRLRPLPVDPGTATFEKGQGGEHTHRRSDDSGEAAKAL